MNDILYELNEAYIPSFVLDTQIESKPDLIVNSVRKSDRDR